MADLLPLPLYRRALEAMVATVSRSPWIVLMPTLALGVGLLIDWLLAPLQNLGLILAAPVKALAWSMTLYVWKRVLLEGEVDSSEVEAALVARARSLSSLGLPLLFGTLAFLTLAYGGAVAGLFALAVVVLPTLEALLLGCQRPLREVLREHGAPWAVSQFVFVSVGGAVWLVAVMLAGVFHVLAGEVVAALVGGPLVTALWLTRGHAWFELSRAMSPSPPDAGHRQAAEARQRAPAATPGRGSRPAPSRRPPPR